MKTSMKKDDVPKLPIGKAEDTQFKKFLSDSEDEIRAAWIDAIIEGKGILHVNHPAPNVLTMKRISSFRLQGLVEIITNYLTRKLR